MITSEEYIKQFMDDYCIKLKKRTLNGYILSVRQMLAFYNKQFNEITTKDVRNWLLHLEEKGYKHNSIRNKLVGLGAFYRYCLEETFISRNPIDAIPYPKHEDKLPHYLTVDQLVLLRSLCKENLKHRAVIEVLYATGVRISELTNMRLEDITWEERMIRIPNGKGKKERIVLFTKECAEHLLAYLHTRSDDVPFVFTNRNGNGPNDPNSIQGWFVNYRKELGVYMTPHTMRHTFAAHLAMRGMPFVSIQSLLGHIDPNHTRLYSRLYDNARKEKYDEWM